MADPHVEQSTPRQKMTAGEPYRPDAPELVRDSLRAQTLLHELNLTSPELGAVRARIIADLLGSFGSGSELRSPFACDYGYNIRVGERTFINFGLIALDVTPITIGDDVQIGPNVQLLTPTHPLDPERRRAKEEAGSPIAIGDNVWIGGGAIILPGVNIGPNSVIGAGSVVTRDVPSGVVAVGNPARVLRRLTT